MAPARRARRTAATSKQLQSRTRGGHSCRRNTQQGGQQPAGTRTMDRAGPGPGPAPGSIAIWLACCAFAFILHSLMFTDANVTHEDAATRAPRTRTPTHQSQPRLERPQYAILTSRIPAPGASRVRVRVHPRRRPSLTSAHQCAQCQRQPARCPVSAGVVFFTTSSRSNRSRQ
jgi:hypothetical protein